MASSLSQAASYIFILDLFRFAAVKDLPTKGMSLSNMIPDCF